MCYQDKHKLRDPKTQTLFHNVRQEASVYNRRAVRTVEINGSSSSAVLAAGGLITSVASWEEVVADVAAR